jgi:hypothetical protein
MAAPADLAELDLDGVLALCEAAEAAGVGAEGQLEFPGAAPDQ